MNVTDVPAQILFCEAVIVTAGVTGGVMVIIMGLLVALGVARQVALLVTMQLITSPFASELRVKVGLLVPALAPFTCHWYCGAAPPLTGVAVNVTVAPGQIVVVDAAILTEGVTKGFTIIVILLLVTIEGVAQLASLVMLQLTTSPFESGPIVSEEVLPPTMLPFTNH